MAKIIIPTEAIKTAEQRQAEAQDTTKRSFQSAIQTHVDGVAITKLYNDGNAMASYVASTNSVWASEAQTFVAWRDAVWIYSYAELDKVMSGEREQPDIETFIDELPVIEWT